MKLDSRTLAGPWRRYGFWAELALAALVVVGPAALVTQTAARRADALAQREATLAALVGAADAWRAAYVPATSAESAAWRLSERRVRERGVDAVDRVALAQLVAQRAEELGIPDVRVGFAPVDDLAPAPALAVDAWTFEMAPYAVTVDFVADYRAIVGFIGSLPPQVAVRRLELERSETGVRASTLLVVYRLVGGA